LPGCARSQVAICGDLRNFRRIGKRSLLLLRVQTLAVSAADDTSDKDTETEFPAALTRVSAAGEEVRLKSLK
jgi:hypothetical protein